MEGRLIRANRRPAENMTFSRTLFRLVVTTGTLGSNYGSTSVDKEYVIDTQTGRVWHSALDEKRKQAVLYPFPYENVDEQLSLIPNESATVITSKSQQKFDDNSTNR